MQAKKPRGRVDAPVQPLFIDDRPAAERLALPIDAPIPFALTDAASALADTARPSRRRAAR